MRANLELVMPFVGRILHLSMYIQFVIIILKSLSNLIT